MPTRPPITGRLAVVVAVMTLALGVTGPNSGAATPPDGPSPTTSAPQRPASAPVAAGPAKVVGAPKPKTPAAFSPDKGSLHPRVRAAYEHAANVATTRWPGCGLRWTILAAFGAIESANGTHHDGALVLAESGRVEPLVIGLPLDGRGGRGLIRDTDDGRLDGDTVYDRAVGPLQFIPDTWSRHGVDANGDGVADPHSIDDAALAAASYLCTAARGNMRHNDALDRAIYSYNHSYPYVEAVRAQLTRFDLTYGFRPNPPRPAPVFAPAPPPPPAAPAQPVVEPIPPTSTTTPPTTTSTTAVRRSTTTEPAPSTTVAPATTTTAPDEPEAPGEGEEHTEPAGSPPTGG